LTGDNWNKKGRDNSAGKTGGVENGFKNKIFYNEVARSKSSLYLLPKYTPENNVNQEKFKDNI